MNKVKKQNAAQLWAIQILQNEYYSPDYDSFSSSERKCVFRQLGYKESLVDCKEENLSRFIDSINTRKITFDQFTHCLRANIERLGVVLRLSSTEKLLLAFLVTSKRSLLLKTVLREIDHLEDLHEVVTFVAFLLDKTDAEILRAISKSAPLVSSGVLTVSDPNSDNFNSGGLPSALRLPSRLLSNLTKEACSVQDLLSLDLVDLNKTQLKLASFSYMENSVSIIRRLIENTANAQKGSQIYVYGKSGLGKTQLVYTLSKAFGKKLYAVPSTDANGDSNDASERIEILKIAQAVLDPQREVILMDEVEDVFGCYGSFYSEGYADRNKAYFVDLLENAPVPVFWLSNRGSGVDPAFIRRFDYVLKMDAMPIKTREQVFYEYCKGFVPKHVVERVACSENISVGVIKNAANVGQVVALADTKTSEKITPAYAFVETLNSSIEAQGYKKILFSDKELSDTTGASQNKKIQFSETLINCDFDTTKLLDDLTKCESARVLVYGPPGTGKTEFTNQLAKRRSENLIRKQASDLISMWVGQTEKNIATAFERARMERAVLTIDEVEAFIQRRENTSRNFELSAVNEMLTQIEKYEGIFIATTNMLDYIDRAVLRRFDLKLKFDYLTQEAVWKMFQHTCRSFNIGRGQAALKKKLLNVDNVTFGDFAALARRNNFSKISTQQELFDALIQEVALKTDQPTEIGFV